MEIFWSRFLSPMLKKLGGNILVKVFEPEAQKAWWKYFGQGFAGRRPGKAC